MSDRTLCDLLVAAAERFPHRPAVVESPSASVTYEVLMSLAQCVRDQLQAHGIRAGEHAGIYLPKSIDAVAVIGGILLNGAVCVPIDPASPTERACFIVRDANLKVLVTTVALADALMQFDTQSIAPLHLIILPTLGGGKGVASLTATLKTHDDARNTCVATPDAPAHLLYTSGSTGIPKGILLSHRAAVVFVEYFTSACNISEADRFSSHAPLHFAMSIFDMFMALCNGAALILIDDATGKDPLRLAPLIGRERISIWFSTPSVLSALEEYGHLERYDGSSLRFVLFAGEVYPVARLQKLMDRWPTPRFFNLFGATETNVRFSYEVRRPLAADAVRQLPIGRPLEHFRTLVVDGEREVAVGEAGELLVSGPGILAEYWNNPALTARAFHTDALGTRWFHTGDVVTEQPDGTFLFRGRSDRMIKRHGYRIELGEIECTLMEYSALQAVAAVAVPADKTGVASICFVVPADTDAPSIIALKQYSATHLPRYMVPDQFVLLDQLPLTSTGKTDYQSLTAAAVRE